MKINIQSIADKGDLQKERLLLRVSADTDIGDYTVLQSGFADESVLSNVYHAFWPPYRKVKEGDIVVIYTRSGQDNKKKLGSGSHAHFYYWGLSKPIWNNKDRAPVLMHSPNWTSKSPNEL